MTGFPFSMATPPRFGADPPAAADVVVIGGGIAGVMTGLFLTRAGQRVVLVEKGRVAAEQSSRNWGWIRRQGRDAAELPIMIEAARLWRDFAAGPGGAALGYRPAGVAYFARGDSEMAGYAAWHAAVDAARIGTRLLSRAETRGLLPASAADWVGAMWTPDDARAEPWTAVPTLAAMAVAEGLTIVEGLAARALDTAAGRITGVITESGAIAAERVLVAGGAWSALLLGAHGIGLPQLSVRATVAATPPMDTDIQLAGADRRIAFRRRADGGFTLVPGGHHDFTLGPDALRHARAFWPQYRADRAITHIRPAAPRGFPDGWRTPRRWAADEVSPFERMRILDPVPNPAVLDALGRDFARTFPGLGRPALARAWAGMIDTTPDVLPVVDAVAALPGLFLLTGLSGHGFGIGPALGRVMADLMAGRPTGHDLSAFRLARFTDGTRLRVAAGI